MRVFAIFVSLLASTRGYAAGGVELGSPVDDLSMVQISSSESPAGLIGGEAVDAAEYPGIFYTSQGNSRCTGTLIGSRVVASAAHCMSSGGTLSLTYNDIVYSGRCTHAPGYRNNSTADWALCLLSQPIPDAIAESVNTDGDRLAIGEEIVLMGFGCIRRGGGGGNDGTLRFGRAPITSLPERTDYDIVTEGTSALCYGDSGGPSFFVDSETGKRFQTGINSRGDIARTSYLSSLHVQPAQDFYRTWATSNNVTICGIHENAEGCRQSE